MDNTATNQGGHTYMTSSLLFIPEGFKPRNGIAESYHISIFNYFETGFCVSQAGLKFIMNDLELLLLLPSPPKFWDYMMLAMQPRTLCSLGKFLII